MPAFRRLTIPVDVAKIFALIAMTADHAPKVLALPGIINDTLGRMAFPLFAFLIIQNYCRTHAFWKYAVRLGIFGVMTSLIVIPFDGTFKNVLFTFLWGLTFLAATEHICRRIRSFVWQAYWLSGILLALMPLILMSDYGLCGFSFLLALYAYRSLPNRINTVAVFLTAAFLNISGIVPVAVTLITVAGLIYRVRLQGGSRLIRWWGFYAYYPLHLVILYAIRTWCGG